MFSVFNRIGPGLARRVRSYLGSGDTKSPQRPTGPTSESVEARLARLEKENAGLRARLVRGSSGEGGVRAENVVWIFGSGRTGSTWLSLMMGDLPGHARWNEPLVGYLFAHTHYERGEHRTDEKFFVLGNDYKETWLGALRRLVLDGAEARFPEAVGDDGYVVIKEPHGSRGASFLMQALPESRIVFLVRDPRDVAASALNASWISRRRGGNPKKSRQKRAAETPDAFIRHRAKAYMQDIELTQEAYDAHAGHKVLVRYEDLRADTPGTMQRICAELEIPVGEKEIRAAVAAHSWENIPKKAKGTVDKGRRKATPGGYREDLTPEQVEIIETEAASILERFYEDRPARGASR